MRELPPDHPRLTPIRLRRDLLAEGLNDRAIARAVRNKDLHRVRHGAYVTGTAWARLDDAGQHAVRSRAVVRQSRTDVVISHVSALPEWEAPLWGFDLSTVHVTRDDRRAGRKEAGVQQHRGRLLSSDRVTRNGVVLTSPERTMIELTTLAPLEPCLVAWNHLLHHNLTTVSEVDARYRAVGEKLTEPMDHWPHTLTTDILLRLADARLESPGESRSLFLFWRQHLPMPVPQYEIIGRHGEVVARVDFAWPELGVFLEFDGRVKYTGLLRDGESITDVVLREKAREELICRLTGWRCIRITWADLERPEVTALLIRSVLYRSREAG